MMPFVAGTPKGEKYEAGCISPFSYFMRAKGEKGEIGAFHTFHGCLTRSARIRRRAWKVTPYGSSYLPVKATSWFVAAKAKRRVRPDGRAVQPLLMGETTC